MTGLGVQMSACEFRNRVVGTGSFPREALTCRVAQGVVVIHVSIIVEKGKIAYNHRAAQAMLHVRITLQKKVSLVVISLSIAPRSCLLPPASCLLPKHKRMLTRFSPQSPT